MRLLCLAFVLSCAPRKQPALTNDLDPPPRAALADEPQVVAADAREIDAAVDAVVDARVAPANPDCADDPALKQACQSMGPTFEPRVVTPCHGGRAPEGPMHQVKPRCMCVDASKPRDCPPKK